MGHFSHDKLPFAKDVFYLLQNTKHLNKNVFSFKKCTGYESTNYCSYSSLTGWHSFYTHTHTHVHILLHVSFLNLPICVFVITKHIHTRTRPGGTRTRDKTSFTFGLPHVVSLNMPRKSRETHIKSINRAICGRVVFIPFHKASHRIAAPAMPG